ncbi:MAG: hypothetical protein ACI33S_03045 [Bacilli bacterium]
MENNTSLQANNNINSTVIQININGNEVNPQVLECLKSLNIKDDNSLRIQTSASNNGKVNKLYNEFASIVNDFDSLFYISPKNFDILKACVTKMEIFEEDFKNASSDGEIFYNNLFALLLRVDVSLFISKYEESPDYVKKISSNKWLYASSLYEIGKKEDAYITIDELLIDTDDDKYFIQKCFFLFNDNKVKELKKVLGNKKKIDKYGYYGLFELYIKFEKEKNVKKLKKLNSKYKGKALFHMFFAKLIFENDKKNDVELKDNLKQAYLSLQDDDLIMLLELLNLSVYVKQDEYILNLLGDKTFSSNIINSKILNILVYKHEKDDKDIERIKKLLSIVKDYEYVNINNANAILSLSLHKELEAIDYFNESFKSNKDRYTAYNLLNLILKNNDQRNFDKIDECIEILQSSQKASDHMLIASAYLLLGKNMDALESSYIGAVLSQNNADYFMRLWAVHTKCEKNIENLDYVVDDCVVILVKDKDRLLLCFDSKILKYEKINSFQGVKFNRDKIVDINIKGKSVGDNVVYKGEYYTIDSIVNKYDYFLKIIFPLLNNGRYFKTIESVEGEDPLKGIKDFLIESKKNSDKQFKMYDLETSECNGLPLSFFVNNEDKTYQNIMMHLLYMSQKSKLYSGEINIIDKDSKIIIDITSLVMLNQFNYLEKLLKVKENIYITQSTINTISKTFNYYLNNNKKESLSVFVNDDNQLCKQELTEEDNKKILEFWRKIYEISQNFNIVNHESPLDKSKLECCQIDAIDYSVKENYSLISEDLLLKKLAYVMNDKCINSSNFLSLVENLCETAEEYIDLIVTLSEGNYIYCISEISFLKILLQSFKNESIQEKILNIIKNILATSFLFNIYLEIIMKVIIFIYYYEEINDIDYFIKILDLIMENCDKYSNKKCLEIINNIKNNLLNDLLG